MKKIKMKIETAYKLLGIAIVIIAAVSCKKNEISSAPQLTIDNITETIPMDGGSVVLPAFTSNGAWSIDTTGFSWLKVSQTSGGSASTTDTLTAPINKSGVTRTLTLIINSTNGQSRRITVLQDARIFPSYNTSAITPDATDMSSTATQIAANITMGWNFYNTMEAPGGETGWGNPLITQQQFDLLKANGINAVRIPIQYDDHLINKKTMQIDPVWLARIHQVIQYGINDGMYVTINIHRDPGNYRNDNPPTQPTGAVQDTADARHRALWEQIATTMRDFDEHLMFASLNEPTGADVPSTLAVMRYHQSFINVVRATGGKNVYRTLVIQAPSVSIDLANDYLDPTNAYKTPSLPTDPTPHKMMLEFHYYTPSQFCILDHDAGWGKELYFWGRDFHTTNPLFLDRNCGAWSEEHYADSILHTVKARFADKGIPLFIGEFQAIEHQWRLKGYSADSLLCLRSEAHYEAYIAEKAKANGMIPFLWAGVFVRPATGSAYMGDQMKLDSLKTGVNRGVATFGSGVHF